MSGLIDRAAVDGADDAPHTDRSILGDFDFGDLRHIGPEHELQGNAAAHALQAAASPQPAFSAASASTAFARGDLSRSASR